MATCTTSESPCSQLIRLAKQAGDFWLYRVHSKNPVGKSGGARCVFNGFFISVSRPGKLRQSESTLSFNHCGTQNGRVGGPIALRNARGFQVEKRPTAGRQACFVCQSVKRMRVNRRNLNFFRVCVVQFLLALQHALSSAQTVLRAAFAQGKTCVQEFDLCVFDCREMIRSIVTWTAGA